MSKRHSSSRTVSFSLPDNANSFLTLAAGALFTLYVMLVITTVVFATMQTSLAVQVRETEGVIASLEAKYYDSVAQGNATTPAEVGMVAPVVVEYAVEKPATGLSFAGN